MEYELKLENVSKRFGTVVANADVDFTLQKGETHVLIGENGAGKTTLMNVLYGLYQPDEGQILMDGKVVSITSPADAIDLGIGMVHQHFMLVENMTVAENVVLGSEPKKGKTLDRKKARAQVAELCKRFQFDVDPDQTISSLSVSKQQKVEILKILYRGADILILDEPTAVLTPSEIDELGQIIRSMNKDGKSVILITHKLREIMSMSDSLTVLRHGRVTGNLPTKEATIDGLVAMMVGKSVALDLDIPDQALGETILEVKGLTVQDSRGHNAVDGLDLQVRSGEIVGIAGVDGNGQSEFLEALMGLEKIKSGTITMEGKDITGRSTRTILDAGISTVAEDRHKRGVVLPMPLFENTLLGNFHKPAFGKGIWVDFDATKRATRHMIADFDVRTPSCETQMMWLSGGNQQKYVMAREISRPHQLLVVAQPTRGVDIGAKRFIHDQLIAERQRGKGVLLVSTELDEILSLSDRVLVMYKGKVVGEVARGEGDERSLGNMMIGQQKGGTTHEK